MTNINLDMKSCDPEKLYSLRFTYRLTVGTIDALMDEVADILYDPASGLDAGVSANPREKTVSVGVYAETENPEEAVKAVAVLIQNALRKIPGLPAPEVSWEKEDPEETRRFLDRMEN